MTSGRGCFCLHFARGLCVRGQDCVYYHRIPTPEDDRLLDRAHDCFGRERHREHRDDRGGVGSFRDPSRTLYVGGLTKAKYTDDDTLTERLHHHFGEWGEVESINFIPRLLIAFVRYRLRSACEFAREAMAGQALDARELLNVRWACEDPNPRAQAANAASDLAAVRATLRQQGVTRKEKEREAFSLTTTTLLRLLLSRLTTLPGTRFLHHRRRPATASRSGAALQGKEAAAWIWRTRANKRQ